MIWSCLSIAQTAKYQNSPTTKSGNPTPYFLIFWRMTIEPAHVTKFKRGLGHYLGPNPSWFQSSSVGRPLVNELPGYLGVGPWHYLTSPENPTKMSQDNGGFLATQCYSIKTGKVSTILVREKRKEDSQNASKPGNKVKKSLSQRQAERPSSLVLRRDRSSSLISIPSVDPTRKSAIRRGLQDKRKHSSIRSPSSDIRSVPSSSSSSDDETDNEDSDGALGFRLGIHQDSRQVPLPSLTSSIRKSKLKEISTGSTAKADNSRLTRYHRRFVSADPRGHVKETNRVRCHKHDTPDTEIQKTMVCYAKVSSPSTSSCLTTVPSSVAGWKTSHPQSHNVKLACHRFWLR